MRLSGIVSSGLGRASIFMAQPHYQEQFLEILNEEAWPGTLNVKVMDLRKIQRLSSNLLMKNASPISQNLSLLRWCALVPHQYW